MLDSIVANTFDNLTLDQQTEVVDFIMFLGEKYRTSDNDEGFPFDAFAGGMTYIAEDFDDTPDCFKDYV